MAASKEVRMEYMTSPQVARYLQKSDLAILPVGCFEMHGPHVPLACDTMHAYSMSVILAEQWDCLVLPPVQYSYPGASDRWPGTIAPRPTATIAWVKELCLAAMRAGFKRLVVLGTHGPLSFMVSTVIREIHLETGQIVLFCSPSKLMPEDLMTEALGYPRGEDILVLASAKILGLPENLVARGFDDSPDRCFPLPSQAPLRRGECSWPWTFTAPWQHQPVRNQVLPEHADKAIEVMRKAAARDYAQVPEEFTRYVKDMAALDDAPPWALDKVAAMKPKS